MNRVVEKTEACDPIESALKQLEKLGFSIIEQRLWDYHFAQLEFKVKGDLSKIEELKLDGIMRIDNLLKCKCHWYTIELVGE